MVRLPAAIATVAAVAAAAALVSGDSTADPHTPPALPGEPAPFLGTAVAGSGGLTAAIDVYGNVVDLRPRGPAAASVIDNPSDRQSAGSVDRRTGIVLRAGAGGQPALPLWRADWVRQRYLPGTNVVETSARVAGASVRVTDAAAPAGEQLTRRIEVAAPAGARVRLALSVNLQGAPGACAADRAAQIQDGGIEEFTWSGPTRLRATLRCRFNGADPATSAALADRRWLARARPLGPAAPAWAVRMYRRSLLVLRALTGRRSGAVAAGERDGWAYVWPRDAAAVGIALAAAGYRPEARRVARFLLGLDVSSAARFHGDGSAVDDGRPVQGDEAGWVVAAARAAHLAAPPRSEGWRDRADYREGGGRGDFLGNAIASSVPAGRIATLFATRHGLQRSAAGPPSGLDSSAAWAVRPFPRPALFGPAEATLRRLAASSGLYGLRPGEDFPGKGAWSAPTAWSAWSLAALGERRGALHLLADLRRAATGAGTLPERINEGTGIAESTTPLAWSHAFAILALRELWPEG